MGFPRFGTFVGIVVVAVASPPPLLADGPAVDLNLEAAGIVWGAGPGGSLPDRVAKGPALPSCSINEGQDGRLDFRISFASAGGGIVPNGRCAPLDKAAAPVHARYRAVPFAPNSIGRPGSLCPTFSPDGGTAVYVKTGVGLVESRHDHGGWTEPAPLPFSGTAARDGDPFLSPDGSRLFFWSTRPTGDGAAPPQSSDLWVVERRADSWGAPQPLGPPVNDASGEPFPAVAADGTLYFGSPRPGGRGAVDLYRSRPNASGYGVPENLGITINSPATELDGYVSPDQGVLVFASDRPGGHGNLDLYVSHRIVGGWSPARNLGRGVNGPDDEFCPQVTPDGRVLIFSRSKGIFQVDAAVLDDATP